MRTRFLIAFALLISSSLVFQNCASENTSNREVENVSVSEVSKNKITNQEIIPPFNQINVPFQSFDFDGSQGRTIKLDNGTSIVIPANAFVDAAGNPINSSVKINYREFHNAADILVSGIPMKAIHNDLEGNMQTAGMFEIEARVSQDEVFLAEGKEIEVNMASYVDGNNYDFWQLEKENGNWLNKGASTPTPNPQKLAAKKELANMKAIQAPVRPVQFDKSKTVLNFDLNLDDFPDLKNMKNIFWQYAGKGENPNNAKWIFKEKWQTANITAGNRSNEYTLTLKNAKRNFSTTVCASQTGKEFEQAMNNYQKEMAAYKSKNLTRSEKEDFMNRQADFLRSVNINQLGIYNYDILLKSPENLLFAANFDFGKDVPKTHSKVNVYLITNEGRSVVAFPYEDRPSFGIDPRVDNQLVAILPNNKIATFSQKDFDENLDDLEAANNGSYTFKMNVKSDAITNMDDLSKAIAAL